MKCWYCGKKLKPYNYDLIVLVSGERRKVCHDDRNCRKGTGIQGRAAKTATKRQAKTTILERVKQK